MAQHYNTVKMVWRDFRISSIDLKLRTISKIPNFWCSHLSYYRQCMIQNYIYEFRSQDWTDPYFVLETDYFSWIVSVVSVGVPFTHVQKLLFSVSYFQTYKALFMLMYDWSVTFQRLKLHHLTFVLLEKREDSLTIREKTFQPSSGWFVR